MTATMTPPAATAGITELYRDAYPAMVRLARSMTGSAAVAEELVQDAFTVVYQRWDGLDTPRAYLRTCVANACRSWHRRQAVERKRERTLPCISTDQLAARELIDAVSALAPAQRAVVMQRFYEDKSEQQIARALGCAVGSVKSNLHRGLRNLRKTIEL